MTLQRSLRIILICHILATPSFADTKVHWSYTGDTGPAHWGELSEDFASCRVGKNQSPIDIETDRLIEADLGTLIFSYQGESTEIINNGHTLQANVTPGSTMQVKGETFELKQFHMHSPSEHQINGESFPLELHFVHSNDAAELAVVGMLFREGVPHKDLVRIVEKAPKQAGGTVPLVKKLEDIFPHVKLAVESYYRYSGSLTTPPCTEGVRWYVYPVIRTVSKEQIAGYIDLIGTDARGPMPLNARIVLEAAD